MVTTSLVGRWGWVAWGLTLGGLVAGACGGSSEEKPPPVMVDSPEAGHGGSGIHTGGTGARGGTGGTGTGGTSSGGTAGVSEGGMSGELGIGGVPEQDPRAPVIEITSPVAEDDPDGPGVLIDSEIDVLCHVTQSPADGSMPVAESTIVLQMLDAHGEVVPSVADGTLQAQKTDNANEYSAHFLLSKVPDNGKIGFRCMAYDTSDPALPGSDVVVTLVDHGPKITRNEPEEDSPHALEGAVHFEFSVDEAPLTKTGDDGAKITKVELIVGGVTIDEADVHEKGGVYTVDVSLDDKTHFPTPPSGDTPVTIRATNARKVTAIESYSFVVDGKGPEITVTAPERRSVAGGLVNLMFDVVDDASGVDKEEVIVAINGDEHHYGEAGTWTHDGDHYTYQFDSRLIEGSVYQAGFTLRATDRVGNESVGESWLIYLDNVAPIVDMNPGNVRQWQKTTDALYCSASFDPLGAAIGGDSDNIAFIQNINDNSALIRTMVWERTNPGAGARYSKIVPDEVFVYVQPNTDEPLLTDGDDDDTLCDDIPKELRDTLEVIHLTALDGLKGAADFTADDPSTAPPLSGYGCEFNPEPGTLKYLCDDEVSDLATLINFDGEGHEPAIYALEPAPGWQCTGAPYELGAHAEEGWVCLAARARDYAGNIGFSRPIRVCYDDYRTPSHPACLNGLNPPSCTDGCDLPPTFPGDADDAYVLTP